MCCLGGGPVCIPPLNATSLVQKRPAIAAEVAELPRDSKI